MLFAQFQPDSIPIHGNIHQQKQQVYQSLSVSQSTAVRSVQTYVSSKKNIATYRPVQLQPKVKEMFSKQVEKKWMGSEKIKVRKKGRGCLGYLVSCLKQYTQKRCPHCAWKGFRRTSLHFWHWYLGSMDTDRTWRDIPGKVESIDEGKDGRAIPFHLPSVLIIFGKQKQEQKQFVDFLIYFHVQTWQTGEFPLNWRRKKNFTNFRKSQIMRIKVPSEMPNWGFFPQRWCYCKNSCGRWKDMPSSSALDDLEVHRGTEFIRSWDFYGI